MTLDVHVSGKERALECFSKAVAVFSK